MDTIGFALDLVRELRAIREVYGNLVGDRVERSLDRARVTGADADWRAIVDAELVVAEAERSLFARAS
jgi:hypothetical protein